MKKTIAIILAAAMMASLAACSSINSNGSSDTSSSTQAEQAESDVNTPPDAPGGEPGGGPGGAPGGGSSSEVVYAGAEEITSEASQDGKTYSSTSADESALMVNTSDSVTITNATVTKTGDSDGGDNCNFYGQNAALIVKGG